MRRTSPQTTTARDELSLVRAVDPCGFGQVCTKYRPLVLTTAFTILHDRDGAEDVTQETFLRAFRCRQAFRGESQVGWWLTRVATNLSLNWVTRCREVAADLADSERADDVQAEVEKHALGLALRNAIEQLPDSLRVPLVMHEHIGLDHETIGQQLGLTASAVRVRLLRARRALAGSLSEWA